MTANAQAGPAPGVAKLFMSAARGETLSGDIARVLRRRLILICLLILVPVTLTVVGVHVSGERPSHWVWVDYLLFYLAIGIFLIPFVILWKRADLSLRQLRFLEAFIFGFAAVFLIWGQHRWFHSGWLPVLGQTEVDKKIMEMAGDSLSLPWFFLIVFYGTCIPNTGRRCALVVGGMAAAAVGLLLALSRHEGPLGALLLQASLGKIVFWLTIGAGIAIFGSQKMSELHRAAVHARKLGQYVLKRKLGEGGMGEIYLAEHPMLRRPCVIKIIRPEKSGDPRNLARFAREVQAVTSLTGPNVVDVFDYGEADDGTFYYVMEYLQGMNLQEMVERAGPQPPERVVYFLRQVCSALHEAHVSGLIHRDVKPGNIFICRSGADYDMAKLVDFGLVYETGYDEKLTQTGIVLGSPLYMSPEQIKGSAPLDGRSDLYGLGLVAYFLLTGQHPFRRADVQAVFAAQLAELPPPLCAHCPVLAADLEAIVLRCLEKDRENRFANAAELETALTRCSYFGRWGKAEAEAWWKDRDPSSQSFHLPAPSAVREVRPPAPCG